MAEIGGWSEGALSVSMQGYLTSIFLSTVVKESNIERRDFALSNLRAPDIKG